MKFLLIFYRNYKWFFWEGGEYFFIFFFKKKTFIKLPCSFRIYATSKC